MACRTGADTPGRSVVMGGTGSRTWRANTAFAVNPVNGG